MPGRGVQIWALAAAGCTGLAIGWLLGRRTRRRNYKSQPQARGSHEPGGLVVGDRPLVTLDLETTGLRVARDRIIEIAAVKIMPDGQVITKGPQRINPRMPISRESSEVTGIVDADVAGCPTWEQVAPEWAAFLDGAVLHGYNAKRFDIPLLRAEFDRAGRPNFPPLGVPVVDSQRVFFAKEQRTLAAALSHYCGRQLEGAHGALPDTLAALDVLQAQVSCYPDLPRSPEALAAWCSAPAKEGDATWDGRFRWFRGRITFAFGSLDGMALAAAAVEERDTLLWMKEQDFPDETLILVNDALAGIDHTRESLAARLAGAWGGSGGSGGGGGGGSAPAAAANGGCGDPAADAMIGV